MFIEECKKIHGDKYDYSKVEYRGAFDKITVVCPKHGEFITTPHSILSGSGCPHCGRLRCADSERKSLNQFIEDAKEMYGSKYDYSKVKYINAHTIVEIICPKHGPFYKTPNSFLSKHTQTSCPICRESRYEREVRLLCEKHNVRYIKEEIFEGVTYRGPMKIDFYLPDYNISIECQGDFHFIPYYMCKKHPEKTLETQIKKDWVKHDKLLKIGIKTFYYVPNHLKQYTVSNPLYQENTFFDAEEMINTIINGKL